MVEIIVPGTSDDARSTGPGPAPVVYTDNFLPTDLAEALRADIDAHFAKAGAHRPETHQVWNYWFIPDLYTYLRTSPEKIFAADRFQRFMQILQAWSLESLGLGNVSRPYLSLYVPGCKQGWHNDSGNGRFAFVYSLTRDERLTTGGQTLVMREGDGLRRNLTRPAAGNGFYESVEPRFNRLVIFDDRVPHGVERVDGSMDPVEGRFVLHGHISESGPAVKGGLPLPMVENVIARAVDTFIAEAAHALAPYHGPMTLRLTIDAAGEVQACDVLIDRVVQRNPDDTGWEPLREHLLVRLEALRFPPASGETAVILPVTFGKPPRPPR
jgi:Rps23 Pro-64 3,4-dihydroxylase Tpa1-like proline 4-hydroxylase